MFYFVVKTYTVSQTKEKPLTGKLQGKVGSCVVEKAREPFSEEVRGHFNGKE